MLLLSELRPFLMFFCLSSCVLLGFWGGGGFLARGNPMEHRKRVYLINSSVFGVVEQQRKVSVIYFKRVCKGGRLVNCPLAATAPQMLLLFHQIYKLKDFK